MTIATHMKRHIAACALFASLVVCACAAPAFTAPPDSAAAEEVLAAYLQAVMRGDCSAGRVVGTPRFVKGNGELCGATSIRSFRIDGPAPDADATEWVFATTLVTTGTADGSIQPGELTWFYDLRRQPNGSWRLVGGGSGP